MAIMISYTNNLIPTEIRINVGSTDTAISIIKRLIDDKIIDPEKLNLAFLQYNVSQLPPAEPFEKKDYPLYFTGNGMTVLVTGVSAGYGGTGPAGTIKLLNMLGFKYTAVEEQLITQITYKEDGTRNEEIKLSFSKYAS